MQRCQACWQCVPDAAAHRTLEQHSAAAGAWQCAPSETKQPHWRPRRHGRCGGEPFSIVLQRRAPADSACQLPAATCLTWQLGTRATLSSCGLEAPRTPHKRALLAASERCVARIRCCIARRLWGCRARRRGFQTETRKVPRSLHGALEAALGFRARAPGDGGSNATGTGIAPRVTARKPFISWVACFRGFG